MNRYIAFLRAINVGGHTVKMDQLRQLFTELGFQQVETFIASGNVIFEAAGTDETAISEAIAAHLQAALGYEVATFLRTPAELARVAAHQAFPQPAMEAAAALNIAFLARPPDEPARERLMALRSEIDDFAIHGREVYWLCKLRQSDSTFSNAALEKALKMKSTLRGASTIGKMAAKYS